ncbi:MAG: NAD(P)H-hydrate dehydratase [Bacteroidota bacterium]
MQPLLTAAAMRAADQYTMDTLGLPGFTLMEAAGHAAARHIRQAFPDAARRSVLIVCGKGNNGGDGVVVARHLWAHGAEVHLILTATPDDFTPDSAAHYALLRRMRAALGPERLTITEPPHDEAPTAWLHRLQPALVVDALLGTGLTKAVRPPIQGWVEAINAQAAGPVVALDVPTGLHSDTGRSLGTTLRCDHTITMAAPKVGLLVHDGPRVAGTVTTAEIGIPPSVLTRMARAEGGAFLVDDDTIRSWLPRRTAEVHKYSAGTALVVSGAPGMTGAAVMASQAAARGGAGYVLCASPASVRDTLGHHLIEVVTHPLPEHPGGGLDAHRVLEALEGPLQRAHALLVGPGLGRTAETGRAVRRLLATTPLPAVIDADALHAMAAEPGFLEAHAQGRWILTPHTGEFRTLAGDPTLTFDDRVATARTYAARWNSVVILKGLPSVVATPDGEVAVSASASPALATAGTGDVLAGLCAGLLAQGLAPYQAAACALHLGGAAAERYAQHAPAVAMNATDLLAHLPHAWHERFR